jgi:hypothetical protein
MQRNNAFRNHSGMGLIDFANTELLRGSRVRWSGVVPEGLITGYWDQNSLKKALQSRGFKVEELYTEYATLDWGGNLYYRIYVTVINPQDGTEEGAFAVIRGEVWRIFQYEPTDENFEVLLRAERDPKTGGVTVPQAPNTPGGNDQNNNSGGSQRCNWSTQSWDEFLACQFGFQNTKSALTLTLIIGLGLIVLLAKK